MRAYSLSELFCLTRAELFALHARIAAELPQLHDAERATALETPAVFASGESASRDEPGKDSAWPCVWDPLKAATAKTPTVTTTLRALHAGRQSRRAPGRRIFDGIR